MEQAGLEKCGFHESSLSFQLSEFLSPTDPSIIFPSSGTLQPSNKTKTKNKIKQTKKTNNNTNIKSLTCYILGKSLHLLGDELHYKM